MVEVHRGHGTTTVRDASGNETQVALNAYNCTHYQIRNGRIARVQVYISDQYAVDNFFLRFTDINPSQTAWRNKEDIWHRSLRNWCNRLMMPWRPAIERKFASTGPTI